MSGVAAVAAAISGEVIRIVVRSEDSLCWCIAILVRMPDKSHYLSSIYALCRVYDDLMCTSTSIAILGIRKADKSMMQQ